MIDYPERNGSRLAYLEKSGQRNSYAASSGDPHLGAPEPTEGDDGPSFTSRVAEMSQLQCELFMRDLGQLGGKTARALVPLAVAMAFAFAGAVPLVLGVARYLATSQGWPLYGVYLSAGAACLVISAVLAAWGVRSLSSIVKNVEGTQRELARTLESVRQAYSALRGR
ncbi:MAG: phage holin family protein [Planctomycetales bacterium]|nr:phage holin family protein [Planctomycetales bacterium]